MLSSDAQNAFIALFVLVGLPIVVHKISSIEQVRPDSFLVFIAVAL